jgi:hypothetical protein
MLSKSFVKQLNIYPTFKFTLYKTSSFELYTEIIEIAFLVKTLKENLEYLDYENIISFNEKMKLIQEYFDISNLILSKRDYFLRLQFPDSMKYHNIVYLIIDTDMQPIYDLFKKFDRVKDIEEFMEEKLLFYNYLNSFKRKLFDISLNIPPKKRKKFIKFSKFLRKIKNER